MNFTYSCIQIAIRNCIQNLCTHTYTYIYVPYIYSQCSHVSIATIYLHTTHYLPTIISTTFTKKLPLFYTASCVFIPKMLFICMNKSLVSEFHISTSTVQNELFSSCYVHYTERILTFLRLISYRLLILATDFK